MGSLFLLVYFSSRGRGVGSLILLVYFSSRGRGVGSLILLVYFSSRGRGGGWGLLFFLCILGLGPWTMALNMAISTKYGPFMALFSPKYGS